MSDLETLKAMVARLETSDKPCVEWFMIYRLSRRYLEGLVEETKRQRAKP